LVATTAVVGAVGALLADVEVTRADEDAAEELPGKDDKVDPAEETPRGLAVAALLVLVGGKPMRMIELGVLLLFAPGTALP